MDVRAEELAYKRLRIFARICFGWGALIVLRLVQLQIVQHDDYVRQAQAQQERQIEVQAPRGAIFDRNGQPLAMSVSVDSVCVNPSSIKDVQVAANLLAKVLSLDANELAAKITTAREARRGFMWVKRKISMEESERLRAYNFDWIEFRPESSRYYPNGELAAHILGGIGFDDKSRHEIGVAGLERFFEKDLVGKPGVAKTQADVRQTVFHQTVFTDPEPGANFTLTIDQRIQHVAEVELAKAVVDHGASTGSLVAMNPHTGEIVALANYPTYNPNQPPKDKASFEARKNLSVMAPFEPGSVFKVITLATALQTTKLTPETPFYCHNGAFTLFKRVIHDAHPYGTLSMADVLAKSSNIGSIKVALTAGSDKLYEYVKKFGFGAKTGLPLPGESGGLVRKLDRWIPSSIGSVAMGHEISTTTVQLARACSVIANGGMLMKPRLVTRIQRDGSTPEETKPEGERILTAENAALMRKMMRGVVDYGTGKTARLTGYSAAGKTGSAQIYDYHARAYTHRYNGSFMGFAPVNNPALVIVVTLNNTRTGNAGFGGVVAAPVFKKVMTAALRFLDVPRDIAEDTDPVKGRGIPEPDLAVADLAIPPDPEPEGNPVEGATMLASFIGPQLPPEAVATGPKAPDFRGKTKSQVVAESMELGVRVQLAGAGVARAQTPQPGMVLQPGESVKVVFSR